MKNNTTNKVDDEIAMFFGDPERVRQDIQAGIQLELKKHKLAGNPICEWKNNKIHWIPADKIQVI